MNQVGILVHGRHVEAVDWEKLMYLLRTNPMMFPQRALNAYDRIMKDRVIVLEEDI